MTPPDSLTHLLGLIALEHHLVLAHQIVLGLRHQELEVVIPLQSPRTLSLLERLAQHGLYLAGRQPGLHLAEAFRLGHNAIPHKGLLEVRPAHTNIGELQLFRIADLIDRIVLPCQGCTGSHQTCTAQQQGGQTLEVENFLHLEIALP